LQKYYTHVTYMSRRCAHTHRLYLRLKIFRCARVHKFNRGTRPDPKKAMQNKK